MVLVQIQHYLRLTSHHIKRQKQCCISLPFDALSLPASRNPGRLIHTDVPSPSTLTLDDNNQQSLQLFPLHVQNTITELQDRFNHCVNPDDRLFELYDKDASEKMWNATLKRNFQIDDVLRTSNADKTLKVMKQAGVLVLFVHDDNEVSIVFTRRSKHLSSHASEISFPGGHYEKATDATIVDTAIREAFEELHSPDDKTTEQEFRQNLYIFGCTTAVPSLRGTPVISVLGFYHRRNQSSEAPITQLWPGNPSEVELVFTVPVTTFVEEQNQSSSVETTVFDRSSSNIKSPSPKYPTSHGTIWGLTAYILQPIIQKMLISFVGKTNRTNECFSGQI